MAGKKLCKLLLALMIAVSITLTPFVAVSPADAATSLSSLQQKQAQLAARQKELTSKLSSLKADKKKQMEYKNTLDTQMKNVQDQVAVLNERIQILDTSIKEKTAQISDKQSDIDQNYEQLKKRLCALYKMGEASTLEIVLNSKSVMDLADKTKLLKSITEHDTELINTLKDDMQAIAEEKQQIESDRESVAADKTTLDQKRKELASLENEATNVLKQLEETENATAAEKKRIDAEEAKAGDEIDKWWKDYYARQAAERARNQAASGGGSSSSSGSAPVNYVGGQFTWPVPGFTHISCNYSGGHRAIDINRTNGKSIAGAPIVAANSGKVVVAQWHYSYGNYVMIDHGGGYSTLYAHASSLAVKAGQTVQKGQTIAYVGSTGNSTGPHCHFEIRVNGVRQNPFSWFKQG